MDSTVQDKFRSPLHSGQTLYPQQAIVAEIEAEHALVGGNRELIARFERKIQATLARVWGEEKPVPAEPEAALAPSQSRGNLVSYSPETVQKCRILRMVNGLRRKSTMTKVGNLIKKRKIAWNTTRFSSENTRFKR